MIFVIGHTKGGVGKSTLAFNIAHALHKTTDEKVQIVDLDFQQTLYFINSLNENNDIDVLQVDSASELIEIFEEHHGYLIVDVGGFDNDINRIALEYADKLIIPISNSVTEIIGFKTFESILKEIDPKGTIKLLLNNIHPRITNFDDIKQAISSNLKNISLLNTVIRSRKEYDNSLSKGLSVLDRKDEKAIDEIKRLTNELI